MQQRPAHPLGKAGISSRPPSTISSWAGNLLNTPETTRNSREPMLTGTSTTLGFNNVSRPGGLNAAGR